MQESLRHILWFYLTQEDKKFFLVLSKFWTLIKPHRLYESGAACAAELLWRTDFSCCEENGMEVANRQALATLPTAIDIHWKKGPLV